MKVALAQLNPIVGDLDGNAERMLAAAREASDRGARLVIFGELALIGYPPQDLLDHPPFVRRCLDAADAFASRLESAAPGLTAVFGSLRKAPSGGEKELGNAALVARGGRIVDGRDKTLLPSYDVFDEDRWFAPAVENTPVDLLGRRLGLTVCEDVWNDELYWGRRRYAADPVAALAEAGADLLVNIAASPFHRGKARDRERIMAAAARRHGRPLLFVNQVGGNDELVFDGASVALDARGDVVARAARFVEDVLVVDLGALDPDRERSPGPGPLDDGVAELRSALELGVRDYVRKCGFSEVVLGLSGGIDSAVVAVLAAGALGPEAVEGVLMPSRYSSPGSVADAEELARRLGMARRTLAIEPVHAAFLDVLEPAFRGREPDVTEENLQARVRGTLLMALSNKLGSLVLSTGNKSELAVGYCTLYGDMNGGLSVLGDCLKTWVRELGALFEEEGSLPRAILDKPPSAELRPDQLDTDALPPYDVLDPILEGLVERNASVEELVSEGFAAATVRRIRRLLDVNEYKRRQAPPVLRVTAKAFGAGRRLPLARRPFP